MSVRESERRSRQRKAAPPPAVQRAVSAPTPVASILGGGRVLRFRDLKATGLVSNWTSLARWIKHEDFPRGRIVGANARVWFESEIDAWLASRPVGPKPPQGGALDPSRAHAALRVIRERGKAEAGA